MDLLVWALPLAALVGGAMTWLVQQWWLRREIKRQAGQDALDLLNHRKALLQEMLEEATKPEVREILTSQIDEVNAEMHGLLTYRLRRALRDAGYPPEGVLVANGKRLLSAQQVFSLERAVQPLRLLPPRVDLSARDFFMSGNASYALGRYDEALADYNHSLELRPDDPTTLNNRGIAYHHLGRHEEALADYNRSLELRPDDAATLYNRGVTYRHLGRYEEALADYNRSLELRPDDAATLCNRGITYHHWGRYEEALADYNRSLELRPDDGVTLYNRGITYRHLGRYEEALADYNRSLELRPDDAVTLNNRGVTYHHWGRYEEALADYNRSLELRPDHPGTIYNMAWCYSLMRKTDEAIRYLEKAIKGDEKYRQMAATDKDFDDIRDDPRFKKLMEQE